MNRRGFSGGYGAPTSAGGADKQHASEEAVQYQPILHYGIDEQECWLARLCASPSVRIMWRERR
jgi:hypothetical protein